MFIITSVKNNTSITKSIQNQESPHETSIKAILKGITVAVYTNKIATIMFHIYFDFHPG